MSHTVAYPGVCLPLCSPIWTQDFETIAGGLYLMTLTPISVLFPRVSLNRQRKRERDEFLDTPMMSRPVALRDDGLTARIGLESNRSRTGVCGVVWFRGLLVWPASAREGKSAGTWPPPRPCLVESEFRFVCVFVFVFVWMCGVRILVICAKRWRLHKRPIVCVYTCALPQRSSPLTAVAPVAKWSRIDEQSGLLATVTTRGFLSRRIRRTRTPHNGHWAARIVKWLDLGHFCFSFWIAGSWENHGNF